MRISGLVYLAVAALVMAACSSKPEPAGNADNGASCACAGKSVKANEPSPAPKPEPEPEPKPEPTEASVFIRVDGMVKILGVT